MKIFVVYERSYSNGSVFEFQDFTGLFIEIGHDVLVFGSVRNFFIRLFYFFAWVRQEATMRLPRCGFLSHVDSEAPGDGRHPER